VPVKFSLVQLRRSVCTFSDSERYHRWNNKHWISQQAGLALPWLYNRIGDGYGQCIYTSALSAFHRMKLWPSCQLVHELSWHTNFSDKWNKHFGVIHDSTLVTPLTYRMFSSTATSAVTCYSVAMCC